MSCHATRLSLLTLLWSGLVFGTAADPPSSGDAGVARAATSRVRAGMVVYDATEPRVIDVEAVAEAGCTPRLRMPKLAQSPASTALLLNVRGLPLRHSKLPPAARGCEQTVFESELAAELLAIVGEAKSQFPQVAIGVVGLPAEGEGCAEVNQHYAKVLAELTLLAPSGGVIASSPSDIAAAVRGRFPSSFADGGGRPVIFRGGSGWKVAAARSARNGKPGGSSPGRPAFVPPPPANPPPSGVPVQTDKYSPPVLEGSPSIPSVTVAGVIAAWGTSDPGADVDGDGAVGGADLAYALAANPDTEPGPPGGDPPGNGSGSPVEAPTLEWGTGFAAPTPQPPPIGAAPTPGFDAKVIARWDVVPFQTFPGVFEVGIVAFHINGIDRVEFSVNGGPWAKVLEPSLNPRSGVYEYWVKLDAASAPGSVAEVRAIAWPATAGIPRVLAGDFAEASNSEAIWNGNHSLLLTPDPSGSLPKPVKWCSPDGSDSTGDGTEGNPFRQPAKAAAAMNSPNAEGGTVYLKAGNYSFGPAPWPQATNTSRWLTITAAPGVARADVVFNSSGTGGLSSATRLVRLFNLTIDHVPGAGNNPRFPGQLIWFDSCEVHGTRTEDYSIETPGWVKAYYVTDCQVTDSRNAIRDATFIRGSSYQSISGSPFGASPFVVNCLVDKYDNSGTSFHGDLLHWFMPSDTRENFIAYGIVATHFSTQGIFAEVADWTSPWGKTMDNVALVNVHIEKASDDANGSWWERSTNHLLMWHVSMPDQLMRWAQSDFGTELKNVSIRGFVTKSFTGTVLPNAALVQHTHITVPTTFGSWTVGEDITTGPITYVDDADGKRCLPPGSPLLGRIGPLPWRVLRDAAGRERPTPSAVGALEE